MNVTVSQKTYQVTVDILKIAATLTAAEIVVDRKYLISNEYLGELLEDNYKVVADFMEKKLLQQE